MKKRILSFFLAIISTFSLVVPVFATNTQLSNNPDKVISTIDYAVTIDECTIDDDNIYIRALSGTDVAERIGNVIYLNGVKEATISDTIDINNSETVMPRTGWVSTDTCPMGTASEYTKLSSTKDRNIELEKRIGSYIERALSLIIAVLYPPATVAFAAATLIIDVVKDSVYADYTTMYFREKYYKHNTLGQFYRRVVVDYYKDADYTKYGCSESYYQWWG